MCSFLYFLMIQFAEFNLLEHEDPRMDQLLKVANLTTVSSRNHSLAAKHATDLLLLRSLGRLFPHRKFTSSLSAGIRALSLVFFDENLLFCNVIEAFFSSLKLSFMHDGIALCLSHLFASLKWRLWSLK